MSRDAGFPWPRALDGQPLRVDAFERCAGPGCTSWSWVRYGERCLCLPCALWAAKAAASGPPIDLAAARVRRGR